MSDLISRQAATDAIYKCTDIYINNLPTMIDKAETYKAISELPSAQPEIIRCKDCRWWDKFPTDSAFPDYRKCNAHALARISTKAKDFCSRAERRTDEGD